jgi:hypothetical protein
VAAKQPCEQSPVSQFYKRKQSVIACHINAAKPHNLHQVSKLKTLHDLQKLGSHLIPKELKGVDGQYVNVNSQSVPQENMNHMNHIWCIMTAALHLESITPVNVNKPM